MNGNIRSYQQKIQEAKKALGRIINNYSDEPVSYEGCDTLMIFTVSGFLGKNKEEDLTWWAFLAMRREAPTATRSKFAARYGNKYFIPYSQYIAGAVDPERFKKVAFIYFCRKSHDDFSEGAWLRERADEGYMILSNNSICFKDPDGQKRFEKNSFYLPVMSIIRECLDINPDYYYDLLACSCIYRQLQFTGNLGLKGSEYIHNKLDTLSFSTDLVVQFYEMIKICEYCIHLQALKSLCLNHEHSKQNSEKLIHPSFGTVACLQNTDRIFRETDLAMDARLIDMELTGKKSSPISCKKVSYQQLCQLVVRLRNRYLGHGIISEKLTFRMMKPLSQIMNRIVREFAAAEKLDENDRLVTSFDGTEVPAIRVYNKNTYYFCGFYQNEDGWYADYLCFIMGLSVRYSFNDFEHPVLIAEPTCEQTEKEIQPLQLTEGLPFTQVLYGTDRQNLIRTMHNMSFMPMVFDQVGDEQYGSLRGTPNFSDNSVNLLAVYEYLTVSEMEVEELHHFYLRDRHPLYIAQYDYKHIEDKNWTDEGFGESAFLNAVYNGFLLPQCKMVLALCGTDSDCIKNPYPWIRNTVVAGFRDRYEYDVWRASIATDMMYELVDHLVKESLDSMPDKTKVLLVGSAMTVFNKQSEYYEKLLTEYGCHSILSNAYNIYFAGMLKNAFDAPNLELSFVALFDFVEFAVMAVVYSSLVRNGIVLHGPVDTTNLIGNGKALEHIAEDYDQPVLKDLSRMRIPVNGSLRELHKKCTRYMPVRFEGDEVSFIKACEILRYLRNRTKGHGFIQAANAADLWKLAMHYTMMLTRFLHLDRFSMYLSEGRPLAGYQAEEYLYYVDVFYHLDGNMPCPLTWIENGVYEYLNYFTGERYVLRDAETQEAVKTE